MIERLTLDVDEDRYDLTMEIVGGLDYVLHEGIHTDALEDFLTSDQVKGFLAHIADRERYRREFNRQRDEPDPRDGYDPSDPKHPDYLDRADAIRDRERGK